MLMLTILFAAQGLPHPGPIKTFGDWVVACDNVQRCEMTSLLSEQNPTDDSPQLSIRREPGPDGGWTVEMMPATSVKGARLSIAGAPVTAHWVGETFSGNDARTIVAAIVEGKDAVVSDAVGKPVGRVSLAGTSAALRFIDSAQGRVGTVSAVVAKGAKQVAAVPAARPLPRVVQIRPEGAAQPISAATYAGMWKQSGCDENYEGGDRPQTERHSLGGGRTLVLIPCGAGAYNASSVPYVLVDGKATVARFDAPPGWTSAEGIATLVNAGFDARTGILGSYAKGRGLGDFGGSEQYVWDGAMFRLIEARSMGECRGSTNWLTVWRAEAVKK